MTMSPGLRKLALTAHVTASVGWLGAVAGFLALAVAGLTAHDVQVVRSVYLSMDLITSFVILPLSIASLLTGLVSSLGSKWGLFRHYWVVIKLIITLPSTLILLVHMKPISYMAGVAATSTFSITGFQGQRLQLVVASGAALVALLVTTTLSVYKPAGLTPYGQRKR